MRESTHIEATAAHGLSVNCPLGEVITEVAFSIRRYRARFCNGSSPVNEFNLTHYRLN
jgi:hypothetical protein